MSKKIFVFFMPCRSQYEKREGSKRIKAIQQEAGIFAYLCSKICYSKMKFQRICVLLFCITIFSDIIRSYFHLTGFKVQ